MLSNLEVLYRLPKKEEDKFAKFIRKQRGIYISTPKETARKAREHNKEIIEELLEKKKISEAIIHLREFAYDEFLKEESVFNGAVLKEISQKFEAPHAIIHRLSDQLFDLNITSREEFQRQLIETFGSYAGIISPYIYQLCLSNTQSRRSRAGKIFEGIIYFLYEEMGYPFDYQAKVGKKSFSELNLGKIVDSILPGIDEFNERRDKVIIGSMKTTLRERWQEVVEEVSRSNIPSIHLLTVDDDISESKAVQMGTHNIVLVVLDTVKEQDHLQNKRSVISFESYFLEEIPNIINYWNS